MEAERIARVVSTSRRVGTVGANLFLGLAVLGFLGLALGPRMLGYRTETMLTGSMAPMIRPGDVAVIAPEQPSALAVGDVISYQIPIDDRRVVSHRVIEVQRQNGVVTFRTKGDANESADPWVAQVMGTQVWTVRSVVPWAGNVIRTLRDPYVSRVLRIVVPTILVLSMLQSIWLGGARTPVAPRSPARPLSAPLPVGWRNPYAVSVYPRPARSRGHR